MSGEREALEALIGPLPTDLAKAQALEDRWQVVTYNKLPLALAQGQGCWVQDVSGRRWLDLYGGHAVALLGHCHPAVVQAIRLQAGRLLFYSNAVYSDVRARAVELLAGLAPKGLQRVFLCNSGTEANETALKIARKHTGRRHIVSMREGFHGRTLGSLGATGLAGYRDPAYPIPAEHTFVPYGDEQALSDALTDEVAAVLVEPIPSMGGIQRAADAWFATARRLCDERGALLIFDEVQTGFGRTGRMFFGEHVGVCADLITGAKGMAGGFPAGVVFVREDLAAGMKVGEQGTTFGGGPLAAAAIAATARVLVQEDICGHVTRVGAVLEQALRAVPGVREVVGAGLLLGVNLDRPAKPVVSALFEAGVIAGTGGDPRQVRLLPPLVLQESEALGWLPHLARALR